MLSTRTLNKFPQFTMEKLLGFQEAAAFKESNAILKCSPEAYIALKDFLVDEEQERLLYKYIKIENMKNRGEKTYEEPKNYWGSLFGIEIKLDPDLLPGEWKFE
jgi:hypothetical protein